MVDTDDTRGWFYIGNGQCSISAGDVPEHVRTHPGPICALSDPDGIPPFIASEDAA